MVKTIAYEKARQKRLAEGKKLLTKKIEVAKREESLLKTKEKIREKNRKGILKKLTKRVESKRIIKPSKTTVKIGTEKMDNILDEANIYFKGELEEAKKSLFS